jgi:hypothetical protein
MRKRISQIFCDHLFVYDGINVAKGKERHATRCCLCGKVVHLNTHSRAMEYVRAYDRGF